MAHNLDTTQTKSVEYIISKITTYHSDHLLWETKVGINNKNMDLYYSVWGKSVVESRERSEKLREMLIETL